MRPTIFFLLAAAAGLAGGIALSQFSLANGSSFDVIAIGPWRVATKAGAVDADPYTRASLELSGEVPLALGEGLQFIAGVDDNGAPLTASCAYRIGPHMPAARYWTLSVIDRKGFPIENQAHRYGFRSSEILRGADQGFEISVSRKVRAGNWLPIGAPGGFRLALRLYDSPLSATAGGIEKSAMPHIEAERCE